jgi:DEAD/DEAH box helicase domain-containing protein
MSLSDTLRAFRQDPSFMRCVTAWERLPARAPRWAPYPPGLDPELVAALRAQSIEQLYLHQARAVEAALGGEHVVLATATASGKTLAYNLPVLQALRADPAACALYLFPTKALAHDQIAALGSLTAALPGVSEVHPYDGDTPSAQRPAIRRGARLLISNPDMLHVGILPHHTRWARFFGNLRYVVLDELHTYRGVFGGHVANVLRRLRRICDFYGARPQFLCASATIGNPRELAERLVEAPVTLVDEDGAPRGEKHLIFYNPPLVDRRLGIRRSATLAAQEIAARFLGAQVQTIVFARARLTTEVLLGYLRDTVAAAGGRPLSVQGYRGGYLPTERRAIERGLRSGDVRGVVATNALELGIDIGRLDACVMTGYPGTVASTWQQAGRAGRRQGLSAAVLVASAVPLDQYLVNHPRYFLGRPVEQALLDPDNLAVLANHLACAAFELPFEAGESFGAFDDVEALLELLVEEQALHRGNGRYTWIGERYPAAALSLRTNTPDHVVIQDVSQRPPRSIGQMDRPSAPLFVHAGAVYTHAGETYRVEDLDWAEGVARVRPAELDYYTRVSSATDVQVVEPYATTAPQDAGATVRGYGEVRVTTQVSGYRRIKRYTHEVLSWAPLDLPEQTLDTLGYWLALTEAVTRALEAEGVLLAPLDYGPNWAAQRDAARARDGYRCRQCGVPEREGRQHDVHHLTPFRTFDYRPGANERYVAANRLENLITLCPSCHRRAERGRGPRGALGGLAYLLRNLAPLRLMCDPGDLGTAVQARAVETGRPTITLYDRAPGGAGLSARLYELHAELLEAAREQVERCPCSGGCPGCVGPVEDAALNAKALTRRLLGVMVGK